MVVAQLFSYFWFFMTHRIKFLKDYLSVAPSSRSSIVMIFVLLPLRLLWLLLQLPSIFYQAISIFALCVQNIKILVLLLVLLGGGCSDFISSSSNLFFLRSKVFSTFSLSAIVQRHQFFFPRIYIRNIISLVMRKKGQ